MLYTENEFMLRLIVHIVAQSVKDVLMSLVDDGLVTMDKIGTSNYFWSYPSAALQLVQKNITILSYLSLLD